MKYWWSILLVVSTTTTITTARREEFRYHGSSRKEQNSHRVGNVLSIVDFGAIPDSNSENQRRLSFTEFHRDSSTTTQTSLHDDDDADTNRIIQNTHAFNLALEAAQPGDTVLVPEGESFAFIGGIVGRYLDRVTIDVRGSMHFVHNQDIWPQFDTKHKEGSGNRWGFRPGLHLIDSMDTVVTCTSSQRPTVGVHKNQVYMDQKTGSAGIINGNGKIWWDEAILGRLPHKDPDYRPRLVLVESSVRMVVENLTLLNSPFWTLTVEGVGIEVAHVHVLVDRKYQTDTLASAAAPTATSRSLLLRKSWFPNDIPDWVGRKIGQPEDLNTDGIDPRGRDIHIHDCIVQNADDSVAVKPPVYGIHTTALNGTIPVPCTSNVTIQDTVLTGFGASIGSVGPSLDHNCVDGVVFRNISMPGTGKGIYVKSNKSQCRKGESSSITNILYDGVTMIQPFWWAVWIGPQQIHEPHESLGGACPLAYPLPGSEHCPTQGCTTFANITLQNIYIEDPMVSPGVILGNETNPIQNLVLENITVTASTWKPWHGKWPYHEASYPYRGTFQCQHVTEGTCKNCFPVPSCLDTVV